MKGWMDPVGSFIECGIAVLAQKTTLMEGEFGSPVIDGDVTDSLKGTGIFDDAVHRTAVRAETLFLLWNIKSERIISLMGFDGFDGYFLWQFCQIIACFHSCFSYLLCLIFYVAIREYHRVAKMAIRASNIYRKHR